MILHDRNPLFPGTLAVTKDLALQVVSGAGGVVDRYVTYSLSDHRWNEPGLGLKGPALVGFFLSKAKARARPSQYFIQARIRPGFKVL